MPGTNTGNLMKKESFDNSIPNYGNFYHNYCSRCSSTNLKSGAGRKAGEESYRCGDCKQFLGYSPLARLKQARRRKKLTECLQILENQGIQGELALFTLSLANEGGKS